jgi:hypothetical protein
VLFPEILHHRSRGGKKPKREYLFLVVRDDLAFIDPSEAMYAHLRNNQSAWIY